MIFFEETSNSSFECLKTITVDRGMDRARGSLQQITGGRPGQTIAVDQNKMDSTGELAGSFWVIAVLNDETHQVALASTAQAQYLTALAGAGCSQDNLHFFLSILRWVVFPVEHLFDLLLGTGVLYYSEGMLPMAVIRSRKILIVFLLVGLLMLACSLAALIYAFMPVQVLSDQAPLAPTLFIAP